MIKPTFKRLFWDCETSYNIVRSWSIGKDISLTYDNIIKERAIICICWKWAGEKKVHSLQWDNGDDKKMLIEFLKVLNSADEIIGQNSDRFDERFFRTRCVFHRIPMPPSYQTADTLKFAKTGFRFNSNRLDYLGKFLGVGGKMETGGYKLWERIVEHNDKQALKKMIKYCGVDVILLEEVFNVLNPYTKSKTHVGVFLERGSCSCPNCGSEHTTLNKNRVSSMGVLRRQLQCQDCGKYFSVSNKAYLER